MHTRITTAVFLSCALLFGDRMIRAQQDGEPPILLTQIGPNAWAALDNPKSKQRSYSNAGVVIGDDGVLVIDTLTSDAAAGHLLKEIRKLTNLPVKFVINTHYHGDHVAGNKVFSSAGATVLAHDNVRRWIHPENLRTLGDTPKPEMKSFVEQLVAPTMGYTNAVDIHLGARAVQVRSFPGHTGGDSVVIVPDAKAVFGGDLIWKEVTPNTIDGSTKPWMETLATLASTYADYTFVPGHGPVATSQDVTALRDYLATVQKLVADARASGKSGATVTEAVLPALKEKYGQWEGFGYLAPLNIAQAEAELSGKKRIPR